MSTKQLFNKRFDSQERNNGDDDDDDKEDESSSVIIIIMCNIHHSLYLFIICISSQGG